MCYPLFKFYTNGGEYLDQCGKNSFFVYKPCLGS